MEKFIMFKDTDGNDSAIRAKNVVSVYECMDDKTTNIADSNDDRFETYEPFDSIMTKLKNCDE